MERQSNTTSDPRPVPGRPPSAPPTIWIVVRPNGDRHFVEKEPLEGIHAWARGQNVTVLQYEFSTVLCAHRSEGPK
jgi:hypothetical protein